MVVCRLASMPTAVPSFVLFSWSFLVNWYIQSIFYTPQSSQSHSYLLASSLPCAIADLSLSPSFPIPTSGIKLSHRAPASITFTFPTSVWCYWSTTLSSDTTHLVHAMMTCILPHSFCPSRSSLFPENCVRFIPTLYGF
jgi:hypothetical protein